MQHIHIGFCSKNALLPLHYALHSALAASHQAGAPHRPRRRMLHPRSELQIFAVLDRLCEVVCSGPSSCTMCGHQKQGLLSCAACIFKPPSLSALHLQGLRLVPDVPGSMRCVCFPGHNKAGGALLSALPEVMTKAVSLIALRCLMHTLPLQEAGPLLMLS